MALRCKPNELAVISYTPTRMVDFHGLFVTTLRIAENGDFGLEVKGPSKYGPFWVVEFAGTRPKYLNHDEQLPPTVGVWPDAWLRPIRDDGSQFDETMFWKCGIPEKHHA